MYKLILISSLILNWNGATQKETEPEPSFNTNYEIVLNDSAFISEFKTEEELDLNSIEFVEMDEEMTFSPFLKYYLPDDFDPYVGSVNSIEYIDMDEVGYIDLGFDPKAYLPENFDPYALDLDEIPYIDMEKDLELEMGFDTSAYLPKGFDPYLGSLSSLEFAKLDTDDEIEMNDSQLVTRL